MRTDPAVILGRIRGALASGDRGAASHLVARLHDSWLHPHLRTDVLSLATEDEAIEVVDLILASGVPVDATNRYGSTALELAAQLGSKRMVAVLLARGADPSRGTRKSGRASALMLAAFRGDQELVDLILRYGGDIRDITALDEVSLLRIHGRVLSRIKQAGGRFPDGIEYLLDSRQALGDEHGS